MTDAPAPVLDYQKIAESIARVSDIGLALQRSGLSRKAAVILLHHSTGVPQRDINAVLDGVQDLRRWCLRQAPK